MTTYTDKDFDDLRERGIPEEDIETMKNAYKLAKLFGWENYGFIPGASFKIKCENGSKHHISLPSEEIKRLVEKFGNG